MHPVTKGTLSALLVAGSAFAQQPSFTLFGNDCGTVTAPSAVTLPRIGQTFVVLAMSGGGGGYEGGVASALMVGMSATSWMGVPLPWTPAMVSATFPGVGSCGDIAIAADIPIFLPFQFTRGLVATAWVIPNQPALIGLTFYMQPVDYRMSMHMTLGMELGQAARAVVGF